MTTAHPSPNGGGSAASVVVFARITPKQYWGGNPANKCGAVGRYAPGLRISPLPSPWRGKRGELKERRVRQAVSGFRIR
jgi:hypothetical protein